MLWIVCGELVNLRIEKVGRQKSSGFPNLGKQFDFLADTMEIVHSFNRSEVRYASESIQFRVVLPLRNQRCGRIPELTL